MIVRRGRRWLGVVTAALACASGAVVLGGCGASNVIDPVAQAATVSNQASGLKMDLALQITTPGLPTPIDATGSGAFDEANRSGSFDIAMNFGSIPQVAQVLGSSTLRMQEIIQGLTFYMKLPSALAHSTALHGKPWIKINLARAAQGLGIPGLSTLASNPVSSDPSQFLRYLRAASTHVTQIGTQTINGRATTGYRAQIQLDRVANTVAPSDRAQARQAIAAVEQMAHVHLLPVTVWIDAQHLVRRMELSLAETASGQPLTMSMRIDIPAYGPQQPAQPPPPSQVLDVTSQLPGS